MVHYKLTYFNMRGAAETARQLFALAGQDFEDFRVEREDWPKYKDQAPFGQVPLLEVDGKKLGQSCSIFRYLAKQFGFAGKTAWDQAVVDSLADQHKDFMNEARPYFIALYSGVGDKDQLKKDVFEPANTKYLGLISKFLKSNKSGYLVGDSITWIDILIAEYITTLENLAPEALKAFPEFVTHKKKVQSLPKIEKWISTRPVTAF